MIQSGTHLAGQVLAYGGEAAINTISIAENFVGHYFPPTGTMGTTMAYLVPAPAKCVWSLAKLGAGATAAAGNLLLEQTENSSGYGDVGNDVHRFNTIANAYNMMWQGLVDFTSALVGSKLVGSTVATQFDKLSPYARNIVASTGESGARFLFGWLTGDRANSGVDFSTDHFWRVGGMTDGGKEYHKDLVAWRFNALQQKPNDQLAITLINGIAGFLGGKGWTELTAKAIETYAEQKYSDLYVRDQEIKFRSARFGRAIAMAMLRGGLLDIAREGRFTPNNVGHMFQLLEDDYGSLNQQQAKSIQTLGSYLSDSGKEIFFASLAANPTEPSPSPNQKQLPQLGQNYTTIPNTTNDSNFTGQGEYNKVIPSQYDSSENNDSSNWFQLLKGVPIALGLIATANIGRVSVQRASNTNRDMKADFSVPTPVSKTKELYRESKIDDLYMNEVVTKLEDGQPNSLITDGQTTATEKVFSDFMKKMKKTGTFRVPAPQQIFELVAAAAATNKRLLSAPDYSAPSKTSLGYMAGTFIRNKLHLAPVISGPRTGLGVRRFAQRDLARRKANQRSYNNFK